LHIDELVERLREGDPRALARALTLVENRSQEAREVLSRVFAHRGAAAVVGITGPAGVGKSTLADALAARARALGRNVAILAIDPTSPLSGGAFLGDRARMDAGARDPSIFIRSMATRGHVGGLAGAAFEALFLLEAAKKDVIFLETVGAGQDEVEVAAAVDATLVVLAPGLGDELQAAKAGILEIADVLVVNKADRDGADALAHDLMAAAGERPVRRTTATTGDGVEELLSDALRVAEARGGSRDRRLMEVWLRDVLSTMLRDRVADRSWEEALSALVARRETPYEAAERILSNL
jgi:LAO/AO transport system kinase